MSIKKQQTDNSSLVVQTYVKTSSLSKLSKSLYQALPTVVLVREETILFQYGCLGRIFKDELSHRVGYSIWKMTHSKDALPIVQQLI